MIGLRVFAAALMLLSAAFPAGADDPPQASGTFHSKGLRFEARGAYAFPGKVGLDDEQGVIVAVSNATFNPDRLDLMWDRRHLIDSYFIDDETVVVYFQFSQGGEYQGLSYYFEPGNGLGFGYDGRTKSTVRSAKGRIGGSLKLPQQDDDDAYFDLRFDVPVAPSDYGPPLPADGGEPGKVYAAYHRALEGDDPRSLESILIEDDAKEVAEIGAEILSVLREQHPTKAYKIVKGFARGDRALLLVEGSNGTLDVRCEVHFQKENGTWRLDDEIMQVRFGE